MAKIFAKFGAKRDENLGDLRNTEEAINFLLDGIKGGRPGFTIDDLEIIKGIFNSNVTAGIFSSASDCTVRFTNSQGQNVVYEPLITLQNRFDRAYFTTSEPFFHGGDGPTARYFDNDKITRQTGVDSTSNFTGFDQFFDDTGRAVVNPTSGVENASQIDQFWEEGEFVYNNKIVNKLLTAYGGVEWTGYYKPIESGRHQLRVYTTGFFKLEFDSKEAPSKEFTFDPSTGTFKMDDVDFTENGMITLFDQTRLTDAGIITENGFTFTGTTIPAGQNEIYSPSYLSTPLTGSGAAFGVSRDLNGDLVIVLTSGGSGYPLGGQFVIDGGSVGGVTGTDNITITISDTGGYFIYDSISGTSTGNRLGQQRVFVIDFGNLVSYNPYKLRMTFFMDEDAVTKTQEIQVNGSIPKNIIFQGIYPTSGINDRFDYKLLYNEKYFDFYNIGDFKKFIDNSINLGGTRIGRRLAIGNQAPQGTDGSNYTQFANLNPIVSYYTAPFGPVSDVVKQKTGTITSGSDYITTPNSGLNAGLANKTEGIEIGNYIVGPGIPVGARVTQIILDQGFRIDFNCTSSSTSTIEIIKHEGLVAHGTNGGYSTNIVPATGLNEDGFSFGTRGIAFVKITEGSVINTDDAGLSYGTFTAASLTKNAEGSGAVFTISRNAFGALQVLVSTAGSGYSNFEWFVVNGNSIGQPGENITLEISALTDAFFTGKPQLVIQKDQLFKQTLWTNTFQISNKTIAGFETSGKPQTTSQTALIDRFQTGAAANGGLTNNSFVLKDQSLSLTNTGVKWYIYQTFGLINDGLASYCTGVFDKRILQKLTKTGTDGAGYSVNRLPSGGTAATTTRITGNGSGMTVWYVQTGGVISYAWVANPGTGYEAGDLVDINGGTAGQLQRLEIAYDNKSTSSVTLRLPDAKDLAVNMYAHLFPSITFNGSDVSNLTSPVRISSIVQASTLSLGEDTAALVTLTHEGGGNVQQADISYVDSVVTRVTFTPVGVNTNKEVCFRPTDTSPPFSATSRGLSTNFNVKLVQDFTSSSVPARAGVYNASSQLSYDSLELQTNRTLNEVQLTSQDYIGGYLPVKCGDNNTYYILLNKVL